MADFAKMLCWVESNWLVNLFPKFRTSLIRTDDPSMTADKRNTLYLTLQVPGRDENFITNIYYTNARLQSPR